MRFTVSEKQELIKMVVESELGVNRTLRELGLNKSTFYKWYKSYSDHGVEGLESRQDKIHFAELVIFGQMKLRPNIFKTCRQSHSQ